MDIAAVAAELCKQEFIAADWTEEHLRIWLRDECECTYCKMKLLENRGRAYYFCSYDHVLPKHKYQQFEPVPDNLVLSCRQCNAVKAQYDPNEENPLFNIASGETPTAQQWGELRARAATYISKTKQQRKIQFERSRRSILERLEAILANDQRRTTDDSLSAT